MAGVVNQPLPIVLRDLVGDIAALLQVPELEVFGGAALDLLADPSCRIRDLDIAARGDRHTADEVAKRLADAPDVGRITPVRDYWVHYRQPVFMFDVAWRHIVLDINFMDHTPQAHFDVDAVVWYWPRMTWDDPYAVVCRPVNAVRLTTALDADNPILLLNRIIKLAAKYDLDIAAAQRRSPVVPALLARAAHWVSTDQFHGRQAHDAHLRAVYASTLKARSPARFLMCCADAGVLDARLAPLAIVLRERATAAAHLAAARRTPTGFWNAADTLVNDTTGSWRSHQQWLATHAINRPALDGSPRP